LATLYKRGDVYYLNWREHGQQWRRSLGKITPAEAEKTRREKAAQLTLGIQPVGSSPTLADWIDEYCSWQLAERKSKKRKYDLKRIKTALGHHHIATLSPLLVEQYKIDRLAEAQPETVGKELRILKAAMNRAVALGVIEKNPIAGISAPRGIRAKAVQFYSKKQLAKLYRADRSSLARCFLE